MGHVARIGEEEMCTVYCWRNMKEKRHLEGLCIDERIILKCFCKKEGRRTCIGSIWLSTRTTGGLL